MSHMFIPDLKSASPVITICVETNLISLGGIYSLQTDFG